MAWFRNTGIGLLTGLAVTISAQEIPPSPAPAPSAVEALQPTALEALGQELQRFSPETSVVPSQPTPRTPRPASLSDPLAPEAVADLLVPNTSDDKSVTPVAFDADSTLADFDALARQITGADQRPLVDLTREENVALSDLDWSGNRLGDLFPMAQRILVTDVDESFRPEGLMPPISLLGRSPSPTVLEPMLVPITENPFLGDPLAPARQKNPYLSSEPAPDDILAGLISRPATPAASTPLVPVPSLFPSSSTVANPVPVEDVLKPAERPARSSKPIAVPTWERR